MSDLVGLLYIARPKLVSDGSYIFKVTAVDWSDWSELSVITAPKMSSAYSLQPRMHPDI
jgi:hypothetical protein